MPILTLCFLFEPGGEGGRGERRGEGKRGGGMVVERGVIAAVCKRFPENLPPHMGNKIVDLSRWLAERVRGPRLEETICQI